MQLQDISIRTASLATLEPVSATIAEEIPSRFVSPAGYGSQVIPWTAKYLGFMEVHPPKIW